MACTFNFKGKEYTEEALLQVLARDPDIIKKYGNTPAQEERILGLGDDYISEDIEIFKAKVAHLSKKLNAEVILDDSILSSRLLAGDDPRVKAAGRPVIVVNPKKIFKTTAIHEFGHIFLDLITAGNGNKRYQEALQSLKGTKLEAEIREAYPHLSEEMLGKELVTTAIGRLGSEIWDKKENETKFRQFLNYFYNKIKSWLGIERSAIEQLTQELLNNNQELAIDLAAISNQEQMEMNLKEESEFFKDADNIMSNIDTIYNEAMARVVNVFTATESSFLADKNNKYRKRAYENIKEVKSTLEHFQEADKVKGIASFVAWSESYISQLSNRIEKEKIKNDGTIGDDLVRMLVEWNSMFDLIPDINQLLEAERKNASSSKKTGDKIWTTAIIDRFQKKLANITSEKKNIDTSLLELERDSYVELMARNDTKTRQKYRTKFEKRWDETHPDVTEKDSEEKRVYVNEMMTKYVDRILDESRKAYRAKAVTSQSDIKTGVAMFASEKQMKSEEIQVGSSLVDAKERVIQDFGVVKTAKVQKDHEEFAKTNPKSQNLAKKYEKFLDLSSDGQYYFTGEFQSDFYEKYNEMKDMAFNPDSALETYGDVKVNGSTYTIDGVDRELNIQRAVITEILGDHVYYSQNGVVQPYITIEEAIGRSEFSRWQKENIDNRKDENGDWYSVPKDEWKNDKFTGLNDKDRADLNALLDDIKEADEDTNGINSLIKRPNNRFGTEFIKLPSILKKDIERMAQGDVKGLVTDKFKDAFKVREDDFETEEGQGRSAADVLKVFADVANREKLRVPIPFRNRLKAKDQSLDLHSIVLANSIQAKNYKEKKEIEAQLLVLVDVMNQRYNEKFTGAQNLRNIHGSFEDKEVPIHKSRNQVPNDAKALMSIIENRLYGIKNKDAGEVAGMNVQKMTQNWLKYSGTLSLVGNVMNSGVNATVGTITNWLEAQGGEHFTKADLARANKTYWKDVKGIANDLGSNVDRSRTNRFLNLWNVMGSKQYHNGTFNETTRAQVLMKTETLRPIAKMGEHMMQSKAMYAIMHNIKVMNEKGQYIKKDGTVVKSKKEAASIDEMIIFDTKGDGAAMRLSSLVKSTTFSPEVGITPEQILLETRNKVKKVIMDMHGNYDSDLQSAAQREFWGKLLFFLRKWIEPLYYKRYRGISKVTTPTKDLREVDRFYSKDLKSYQEGYYVTALRVLGKFVRAMKTMDFQLVGAEYKQLSAHEKANARKMASEIAMISLLWMSYMLAGGDDDDDNVNLRYGLRRTISEMSYFFNPIEAGKIASTPTASVGVGRKVLDFITQIPKFNEMYEQGKNKDKSKLGVKFGKLIPLKAAWERDVEESLKWLNNSY